MEILQRHILQNKYSTFAILELNDSIEDRELKLPNYLIIKCDRE